MRVRWIQRSEEADLPLCPVCRAGGMVFTGTGWPTSDWGYHHICDMCGVVLAIPGRKFNEWLAPFLCVAVFLRLWWAFGSRER